MNKLTKTNIEELAKEIIAFLDKEELASDVRIYFNNKVISNEGRHWKSIENIDPHNYFGCAYDHILSMSFEGPLYEVLNYTFGREEKGFSSIFEKWGLYYEIGDAWNLSAYPINEMEVEYTKYKKPKETIRLYRGILSAPSELSEIMDTWYELSKEVGDIGSCVLGAGFEFEWEDSKYFMSACSPYQGSISWETHKDKIKEMLEDIGATEIYYKWGNMD